MAIPEWAQEGMTVAIKGRSSWYSGRVVKTTKARIHVRITSGTIVFQQQKYDGSWVEYGTYTSSYYKPRLFPADSPEAKAGLALAQRALAAMEAKKAAENFANLSAKQITVKDAEIVITALSHFINFIKASEANASEG